MGRLNLIDKRRQAHLIVIYYAKTDRVLLFERNNYDSLEEERKKERKRRRRVKNRRRKMKDGEEGEERGEKRFDRGANLFKNKTGRFDKLSFRPL